MYKTNKTHKTHKKNETKNEMKMELNWMKYRQQRRDKFIFLILRYL